MRSPLALYLTPAALGYLAQLILALLINGYLLWLVWRAREPRHGLWVTGFMCAFTIFTATLFLETAWLPTPRLYAVFLQIPFLSIALICLSQFAYHYPARPPALRFESRLVLSLSGLYALWEIGCAIFRFARLRTGVVEFRVDWTDAILVAFLVWPVVVFVRQMILLAPSEGWFGKRLWQAWLHPPDRQVRALRAFTLIFLLVGSLGLLNILRTFYLLSVALTNLGISIGILVAEFAFALAYLNQRAATTSFMVKIAGITLTTVLAIMGSIGWVISPAYGALYQPDFIAPSALRFMPNARGGYDVAAIPFSFEADFGRDLQLDDGQSRGCSEVLDFAFSFYGRARSQVYVCNDGAVAFGQPVRYREYQYRYGAGVPLLLPLLIDLDPTTSPGGVFARQEPDRLILTWDRLHGFRQPETEFTFQTVLYADGAFDFVYAALSTSLVYRPNADPGANLWAIGVLPGDLRGPDPQIAALSPASQSGPNGIVRDYLLEFRQHLHRLFAPLAGLILVASLFIVVGFPLLFYVSLVNPLNALLRGVRRIAVGKYETTVPVHTADEIGFLTRTFNDLAAQMGDLIRNLEARVAARTEALDVANAQLRAEIVEREQAQAQVVEQQRALAALDERARLSRELHDGLGQVMGYINVQAQAAQTLLVGGQSEAANSTLTDLTEATQDAHTTIRAHILGLRARDMTPQDFLATIQEYLKQFGQRHHIATALSAPEPFPQALFVPAIEEQATCIFQEALTNVYKHAQARRVDVTFSLIGDHVQMIIADDGVGFEANRRVSQPATSNQDHFGLQIMRERAQQVGGSLEIRSAPGSGTRVLVILPRYQPVAKGENSPVIQDARIVLADDHPLYLDGLRSLLSARGLNVVGVARDGLEVQEKARALRPDVVVMDLNMPKCNGLEATRAIKAEFPEIKIVVLTVAEDENTLFEAIKSGASGYLLKSLDANQFCTLLAGLMRGDAPLAPGMASQVLAEFSRLAHIPAAPHVEAEPELSPRQWEVLGLVAEGVTYREIAQTLHLSQQTIKYHMGQILDRLNLENRTQAIAYYRQQRE